MNSFTAEMNSKLQVIIDECFEKGIQATIKFELNCKYVDNAISEYGKRFKRNKDFVYCKIKTYN